VNPSDVAFLKGVIAFVLIAGTGMSAFWLWLRERRRGRPDVGKIVDAVREENATLQADLEARILELEERVDFVERRLVQAPKVEPLRQPRITTPV
jgi:hypothetical protein